MSNLLTVKQVAKRLAVSQTQVFRYLADGSLTSLRLSDRVVRFTEEEIATFLRRSETKPPAEPSGGDGRVQS